MTDKSGNYITDYERLVSIICRFMAFVQSRDKRDDGVISFTDKGAYLYKEEGYKSVKIKKAQKLLEADTWEKSWIGTGQIAEHAIKAMSMASNLVNRNQQIGFRNRLNPEHKDFRPEAEEVLYHIYSRDYSEAEAFQEAVDIFGGHYDRIAYLFFLKDENAFLPISSGHFDRSFQILNIDFKTSGNCRWDNYTRFIDICDEVKNVLDRTMQPYLQRKARLIDAHSFLWIVQEDAPGTLMQWEPDAEIESLIEQNTEEIFCGTIEGTGGKRITSSQVFSRSAAVADVTRSRANGMCQLCGMPAPFEVNGKPFLEVHHIEWLSRGGKDSTDNTAALCPNCHRKMHMLDLSEDVKRLKEQCKG